jgi:Flp pilus assembly protein TadD
VEGARVPLMKAAELDQQSRKIASNVILLMLVDGHAADAKAAIVQLELSSDVRAAIGKQAEMVETAVRERRMAAALAQAEIATSAGKMVNGQSRSDPAGNNTSLADGLQGRLLDRPSLSR